MRRKSGTRRGRVQFVTGCILFLSILETASAQIVPLYDVVYRPPGVGYMILPGDHFNVIYQWGLRGEAEETLIALESSLVGTDSLIGVRAGMRMPVVLSGYSDRGNGFVTSLPFKQELTVASVKGRGLSRRHPDWLSVVAPHEAVHAAQAEYSNGLGIVGLVRTFSPDVARGLNLFGPPGIAEGLAVYRESRLSKGAGRLNDAFFNMQFRASYENAKGWSLAQMLEKPGYTTPFDRYYPGGAHLIKYFKETYSSDVVQRLLTWQYKMPFLGYGSNLLYATHKWPLTLQRDVRSWYRDREDQRIRSLGTLSDALTVSAEKGLVHRRPRWLNENTVVVFAVGYNVRRGFYRYDMTTGKRSTIVNTTISDDAFFALNQDSTRILYSRYVRDPFVETQQRVDAYSVGIDRGSAVQESRISHVLNPVQLPDGRMLALRNNNQFNSIVEITDDGLVDVKMAFPRSDFVSLLPRPRSDSLAIILKDGTHQALFLADAKSLSPDSLKPWIGFENATIYDAAWSTDGDYLTFTADLDDVLNVYVLRASNNRIWRVTNVKYAAMEGSFSPSGDRIAYVEYHDQKFDLKVIDFNPEDTEILDPETARFTESMAWKKSLGKGKRSSPEIPVQPYEAFSNVALRMIYPTIYLENFRTRSGDATLGTGVGLALQFTDPLEEWTFYAEGIVRKSDFWGEIGTQWGGFILKPLLSASNRPTTVNALIADSVGFLRQRVIRQRKEVSLGIRLPITITDNVFHTSFSSSLSLNIRRERFLDNRLAPLAPETRRVTLSHGWAYRWKVQRNRRDLIPNSGVVLRGFGDIDLYVQDVKAERAITGLLDLYVPLLTKTNTGIRFSSGILEQNSPSVFNLDFFKPTGREDIFLPDGTFSRLSAEIRQPVLFVDDGVTLLPLYVQALYVYGFGDHVQSVGGGNVNFSSIGAGAGIRFRLFYFFNVDFRFEADYLPETGKWNTRGWANSIAY